MRKVADLHLHTTASDGSWTPSELVVAAAAAGISCIAVTDHDTVDGVHEALGAGSLHGVEVIAGVELSTVLGGSEVHLLGYLIDPEHDELRSTLDVYRRERERRIHRIVDRLADAGLILTADEVFALAGGGSPGRPHVARVLVERGYARSVSDAFDKWLAKGRPGYVARARLELPDAVGLVHRAGGLAVCAHPGLLPDGGLLDAAVACGIDGLEVVHSEHDQALQARFDRYARAAGLARTGGSDAHGPGVKDRVRLGDHTVPYEWVEELYRLRREKNEQ